VAISVRSIRLPEGLLWLALLSANGCSARRAEPHADGPLTFALPAPPCDADLPECGEVGPVIDFDGRPLYPLPLNLRATLRGRLVRTDRCPSPEGECFALAKRTGDPTLAPGEAFACLYGMGHSCAAAGFEAGDFPRTRRTLGCRAQTDGGTCCGIKTLGKEVILSASFTPDGGIEEGGGLMCASRRAGR
jgi:hypothetical protein